MIAEKPSRLGKMSRVVNANRERTRCDVLGFFVATSALWAGAHEQRRDYLTWDEWNSWGNAAIEHGLVKQEHLTGKMGDPHPRFSAWPNDPALWHVAIVRTWRRVLEAIALGKSAEEFHRDEMAAKKRDEEKLAERDRQEAREIAERVARMNSRGNRNRNYAGDI